MRWESLKLREASVSFEAEIPRREAENRALTAAATRLEQDSSDAVVRQDFLSREIAGRADEEAELVTRRDRLVEELSLLEEEHERHRRTLLAAGFLPTPGGFSATGSPLADVEIEPSDDSVEGSSAPVERDREALEEQLEELQKEFEQLTMARAALEEENVDLRDELAAEQSRNDSLREEVDTLEAERTRLSGAVAELEGRLSELTREVRRLEEERSDGRRRLGRLDGEIRVLGRRVFQLRDLNDLLGSLVEEQIRR